MHVVPETPKWLRDCKLPALVDFIIFSTERPVHTILGARARSL